MGGAKIHVEAGGSGRNDRMWEGYVMKQVTWNGNGDECVIRGMRTSADWGRTEGVPKRSLRVMGGF